MKFIEREKSWETLGTAQTPDGGDLTLVRDGNELIILANGKSLMSSARHGSEEALATEGCVRAKSLEAPSVLVGGLGMGYTLRATLDVLPPDASVVQAELMPEVIEWNRGPLGPLAQHPLDDPRVRIVCDDVAIVMRERHAAYDAILLDVDNGPVAFTQTDNDSLYGDRGLAIAKAALKPGGVLAVWSAWDDRKFEHRLKYAGFTVQTSHPRARLKKGGPHHTLFLGFLPLP